MKKMTFYSSSLWKLDFWTFHWEGVPFILQVPEVSILHASFQLGCQVNKVEFQVKNAVSETDLLSFMHGNKKNSAQNTKS